MHNEIQMWLHNELSRMSECLQGGNFAYALQIAKYLTKTMESQKNEVLYRLGEKAKRPMV